jgi:hypothetical protein
VSSRLDAIAAGASSSDAEALADTLAQAQSAITGLSARLDALEARRGSTDSALESFRDTLADLQQGFARLQSEESSAKPVADRAVAASGLEAAITTGTPFAAELAAAKAADPALEIPAALEALAASGLPDPDQLVLRFEGLVPAMLAARPGPGGADWQQNAVDWLSGMLAVRPSGETQGDTPEAIISRLEAAMPRHDFAEADRLFAALPPAVRAAAGQVPQDVAAWAAADRVVAGLRAAESTGTEAAQ